MMFRIVGFIAAAAGLVFLLLPIIVVFPLAFNTSSFLSYPLAGFSLQWFETALSGYPWVLAFKNSFVVALCAAALSVLIGGIGALGIATSPKALRAVLTALFVSPLVVPSVVLAVGMAFVFARMQIIGTMWSLVLAHSVIGAPLAFITVAAALKGIDPVLDQAAASLGARRWRRFWTVTLPLAVPGFITGWIFAFIVSFDEVIIALFLSSPHSMTLPIALFGGLRDKLQPTIVAVALLLTLLTAMFLVTLSLMQRFLKKYLGRA